MRPWLAASVLVVCLAAFVAIESSAATPPARLVVFTQYVDNGPGEDDDATLYIVRLGDRTARRLTVPCVDCSDEARWSPDGSTIAFSGWNGSTSGILAIRPDGTGRRMLCASTKRNHWCDEYPAWSPDGREIAFALARGGIGIESVGGGSVKLVPHSGGYGVTGLDWSPSGGQLAFESRFDAVDAIGADGTHARRIASAAIEPRWSPDGTRLLSKSEDQLRLLILTTRNRRSMSLAVSADSAGWWDGSSVFYAAGGFYVYALATRTARRVGPLPDVCNGAGRSCGAFDLQPAP